MVNSTFQFSDSVFKFTSPIRFFKSNDPYFRDLDNLPLAQLLENDNFLKDQLQNIKVTVDGIDRSSFTELQPYVAGTDNLVRVQPGRFIGRVNSVYGLTPILNLSKATGTNIGELESYNLAATNINLIEVLKQSIAASAMQMNGLIERALVFSIPNEDGAFNLTTPSYAQTNSGFTNGQPFPITQDFRNILNMNVSDLLDFKTLAYFNSLFVQHWRGVVRTSVVDIPQELTIDVPKFDPNDYFYVSAGQLTLIPATQRIDLVFIYTHPIDASGTAINEYNGNSPTIITRPRLGLVKGAGLGITKGTDPSLKFITSPQTNPDADNNFRIIPHIADGSTDNGFSSLAIHGSFPSPDDLMNLSPLLVDTLQSNDLQLIGQTILPICYVVVRSTANQTSTGNLILQSTDIIDIRPFFRTAELSYNERAGIAAAVPQLSFANPAVGQLQLDRQIKGIKDYIDGSVSQAAFNGPKVVAAGVIRGGLKYGVEGALFNQLGLVTYVNNELSGNPNYSMNTLNQSLMSEFSIPLNPEWDPAEWTYSYTPFGPIYRNDWLHTSKVAPYFGQGQSTFFGNTGTAAGNWTGLPASHSTNVVYVKKKIYFSNLPNFMRPENGGSYDVRVNLQHSVITSIPGEDSNTATGGKTVATWVERFSDHFIIYVAWALHSDHQQIAYGSTAGGDSRSSFFQSMIMTTLDLPSWKYTDNTQKFGIATYPTVTWEVIGYPSGYFQSGQSSIITLNEG